ncbi:MAG: hypothetical protein VB036_14820 [Propionicimonas sp.]|nr:hypothetical protein [Propionicimonas sp.]
MARRRLSVQPIGRGPLRRPVIPVRRLTLRPEPGMAPLDALVATPPDATGALVYVPGFNTPLGEWEVAKCQLLADASGLAVVVSELPGLSHHGDPIPEAVRRDLLRQRLQSWAELNFSYVAAALRTLDGLPVRQLLGYSTGCSLATASLPWLAELGTPEALSLIEPVAIAPRRLAALAIHDAADLARLPAALTTNRHQGWLRPLHGRMLSDHAVHYTFGDLLALTQVLRADELPAALGRSSPARVALVRGERSALCPRPAFEALDRQLEDAGVAGPTIEVRGLGHQLWHSFPALVTVARAVLAG